MVLDITENILFDEEIHILARHPVEQVRTLYLADWCSLFQWPQLVCVVQGDTVHTHRLLVLLTVENQRLHVQVTGVLTGTFLGQPQI